MDTLVTGADQRQGLAVIRALGSRGLSVVAAGADPDSLGFRSRYASEVCHYPSPTTDKESFVATVLEAIEQHRVSVVIPVVESTVIAIDEYRDRLEGHARLAVPSSESLASALDKKKTYDLAASLGIDVPRTAHPRSFEDARVFAREVGFPLVIKPRAYGSYRQVGGGGFDFKVRYLKDERTFDQEMSRFEAGGLFPMLQEYCPGACVPQSVLCDRGKIVGAFQHRRGRDYPLSGGVASVIVSEAVDPHLLESSRSILEATEWHGIAQLEYRVHPDSGRRVLLEINGRFWAPVSAAIQLGLNFPYALYELTERAEASALAADYPIGRRFRYLRGDMIALEKYLMGETRADVAPLPSKPAVLWEMLKDCRPGVGSDVFSWSDPLPSLVEWGRLIRRYGLRVSYYLARTMVRWVAGAGASKK